jgi:hypothetical protein
VSLGPVVNAALEDCGRGISRDGTALYFSSSRAGVSGVSDLFVTTRTKMKKAKKDND